MTCKRKFALKRSYNARKARSERWRQQHEAEIEETNASPAPRGSDSQLPSTPPPPSTHSPPPSTHPPPPPPQASTSSTSADQAQPATSVSTGSPPPEPFVPRGKTTFEIRQELFSQDVTSIKPPALDKSHEFFPVTLAQLDMLVQR